MRHSSKLLASCLIAALASVPAVGAAQPAGPVNLNFKEAEVDSVIGAFGHLLDKSFVIDPRVRGKISLETPRPVSRDQAFTLLKTVLRQQGFAIVDLGDLYKVVPEADAKLQSGPVEVGRKSARRGDEIITQVFQLNHESATNMIPVLRPLVSPNNTVTAYPGNNTLIITDYAANLQRLSKVIARLDSPRANADVQVVQIKNSIASDVAVAVSKLLDDAPRAGGGPAVATDPGQRVVVMADPRTNTVLLRTGNSSKMAMARALVERLDQPASADQANMRVVYLKNAEAIRLVEVLQAVLSGEGSGSFSQSSDGFGDSNRGGNRSGGFFDNSRSGDNAFESGFSNGGNQFSFGQSGRQFGGNGGNTGPTSIKAGGAIIAADPATNSLIITAPEPVYRNIRTVIDQLDSRRAQVYIESLIVEVRADTVAEMGIQWQFMSSSTDGRNQMVGGTNLPAAGSGANILEVSQNPAALANANGLNIGLIRSGGSIFGSGVNLGLLARALERDAGGNIRATPNLLTLDNEEARIIIGQNVPFVTGQYTNTNSSTTSPFQTIERKDVGTMLRVRPQVSEGGTVKMEISQEISAVVDTSQAAGIITSRRAIDSNVLVDDGQIVVLGGLIEDRVQGTVSKVPLLGDIPFLGRLFRYDSRTREKTNLLVFLRPVVLRDAASTWDVTTSRYDYIGKRSEEERFGRLLGVADVNQPGLDPLPPRPGSPGGRIKPSREPSLMPGALDEALEHEVVPQRGEQPQGVRPTPSLKQPQLDLPGVRGLLGVNASDSRGRNQTQPAGDGGRPADGRRPESGVQTEVAPVQDNIPQRDDGSDAPLIDLRQSRQ